MASSLRPTASDGGDALQNDGTESTPNTATTEVGSSASSVPIVAAIQALATHHRLTVALEQHLGAAEPGEDYATVADMLVSEFRAIMESHATARIGTSGDDAADKRNAMGDAFRQRVAALGGAEEDDEALLPPKAVEDVFGILYDGLEADLTYAVNFGTELLSIDATREKQRQLAALQQQPLGLAGDGSVKPPTQLGVKNRVKLTTADRFLYEQLQKAQSTDTMGDYTDEVEEVVEVEVTEVEPTFLMGKLPHRSKHLKPFGGRGGGNSRGRGRSGGLAARLGLTVTEPTRMFASQAAKDAQERDLGSERNSLVRSAARQKEFTRERRELRALERRMKERGELTGDDTIVTTRSSLGGMLTELDEPVEERGVRGPLDVRHAAAATATDAAASTSVAPWMKEVSAADTSSFGKRSSLSIQEQRARLPIAARRSEIVETVKRQNITVLVGETGSGKTTQLARYLHDAGMAGKGRLIGCTQPRRVAAISVAERVALEFGCRVGEEVGYSVRFKDETSSLTVIKFMTDGMLLREALFDDSFPRYSVLILDEAHERSINTDVLFGMMRRAVQKRPNDLRIVITSATLDIDRFCQYFSAGAPLLIEGRTFPVEKRYLEVAPDDYVEQTARTIMEIHLKDPPGDVLAFLTGQDEIDTVHDRLQRWCSDPALEGCPEMVLLTIYSSLPSETQSLVFERTPKGKRKVVLATNIAETSITIDELFYVVDCGYCKQNRYDPRTGVEELAVVPVSQQQADQRAGRAGRTGPGRCYRLYTEHQFQTEMLPVTVPEIQRVNLCNVVLTLKAIGIHDLLAFDFMDPPPQETLVVALERLHALGALDDLGVLTKFGSRMSELPIDPSQSKTLLIAVDFECAPTVLSIVAMLAIENIFHRPRDRQEEADHVKAQFQANEGDPFTLLNVYDGWVQNGMDKEWCDRHFVHNRAMKEAHEIRSQLQQILVRGTTAAAGRRDRGATTTSRVGAAGGQSGSVRADGATTIRGPAGQPSQQPAEVALLKKSNANVDYLTRVRKALTAGYFFHTAKRMPEGHYVSLVDRREVYMHPTSALFHIRPRFVIYHDIVLTAKEYMRQVMSIDPRWLVELAPGFFSIPKAGQLTREQAAMRLDPTLRMGEEGNSWRISKLRKVGRK